jgi:hypothetical protein
MNNSLNQVLDDTQKVLQMAEAEIEGFLAGKKTENLGITQLSKDIAKSLDQNFTFVYQVVSTYVRKRGDLKPKRGPHGGLVKIDKAAAE